MSGPISKKLEVTRKRLAFYILAVNQIDDYFEYRMESKKDQEAVREILAELTKNIKSTM